MLHLIQVLSILGMIYYGLQALSLLIQANNYSKITNYSVSDLWNQENGYKYFWGFIFSLVIFLNS